MKFIHIYTASNEVEAHLIQGLLENNGIKSALHPDNSVVGRYRMPHLYPWFVYVPEDKAEKAKRLLTAYMPH